MRFIAGLWLLLSSTTAPAQEAVDEADLERLAGSARWEKLHVLAQYYKSEDPRRAKAYAEELLANREAEPDALTASVLEALGWAEMRLGNHERALELAGEAMQIAEAVNDKEKKAAALQLFGLVYLQQDRFGDALDYFQQGLELSQSMESPESRHIHVGQAYNNIGIAHRNLGEYPEAIAAYQQALFHREQTGKLGEVAQTLNNLGVAYDRMGNLQESLRVHQRSLTLKQELGEQTGIADSLYNIAAVYQQLGDDERALTYFRDSYEIDAELGNKSNMAYGLTKMGELYAKAGQLPLARKNLQDALSHFRELGADRGTAWALEELAKVEGAAGSHELQRRYLMEALRLADGGDSPEQKITTRQSLAEMMLAQGEVQTARKMVEDAMEVLRDMDESDLRGELLELSSRVYEAQGDLAAALAAHREFRAVEDSMLDSQRMSEVAAMQAQLDLSRREQEILALRQQNEIQALEVARQRALRNSWLIGGGLFLVTFLLVVSWLWYKRQLRDQQAVNARLRHIDRLKDEFLATTSHELRTPLNGIVGLAEAMLDGASGPIPEKARDELRMVASSGRRLAHMVNDILDFSKLKKDKLTLNQHPVDMRVAAEVVIALSTPLAKNKPVELRNEVPNDLPPASADENRLQQILHNLVGNALKFTDEGEVRINATATDEQLTISVSDTGIGIPEEHRDRIFDAFQQVDSSDTRAYGGAGLGLAITRQLVELHGGRIWIEPDGGQGTTFCFTLPCAQTARTRRLATVEDDELLPAEIVEMDFELEMNDPPGEFTILVVDDETVNRRVVHNFLAGHYQVIEARDGQEALERVDRGDVDLILLDIMMPKMSGYEVAQKIREHISESDLPIVLLTAKNQLEDLMQGFSLGANDYLTKPVSREELVCRVGNHLKLLDSTRNLERKVEERTAALAKANERLRQLSETDFLTRLPNRRTFVRTARRHIDAGVDFCIVLCDLDNFKKINDERGHDTGDAVLKAIGREFNDAVGDQQMVARWGGEEFIFMLPEAGLEDAHQFAESLRERLTTIRVGTPPLSLSATFGVAAFDSEKGLDASIADADRALYDGKRRGKNRTVRVSPR